MRLGLAIILAIIIFFIQLVPYSLALENALDESVFCFRLLGTILESDYAKSLAIVKDTGSEKQIILKVGSELCGYQVAKIKRAEVVLLKDGKTYLLRFPLGSDAQPIVVVSPKERIVNRSAISKKVTDLNVAGTQVVSVPCVSQGKVIGIKIAKIKDKEMGKLAGLEEGDVITKINNERLDSVRKTLEIFHSIQDKEKVFVEIKRGNDIKNLVYHLN